MIPFRKVSTFYAVILLAMSFSISGCGPGQLFGPTSTPTLAPVVHQPLPVTEVRAIDAGLRKIANQQVEVWNSHDAYKIRQLYTQDIVHFDGVPRFVGNAEVYSMAIDMMNNFPDMGSKLSSVFIGREDGFDVWEMWNLFGFTQDQPGIEYDLLQTRDGLISYWTLFYGPELMKRGSAGLVNEKYLSDYAAAWSSGNAQMIAGIYAPDAALEDSLFRERRQGRSAIQDFAAKFYTAYPAAQWELLQPFGESYPGLRQGGIFAIHLSKDKPCDIRTLILLEPSDGGIVSERVYYDAESLIACNWAR